MRTEIAISLVIVVMDALKYRKTCPSEIQKDLPD